MYRQLRVCASGGGIEAVPEERVVLDLARIGAELRRRGIPVVDARVMLIASMDPEVTIARTGRLLFKTARAAEAEKAFETLRAWVGLPSVRPV